MFLKKIFFSEIALIIHQTSQAFKTVESDPSCS